MKVLVTGITGQVGSELAKTVPAGIEILPISRQQADLTSAEALQRVITKAAPDVVINAAAYTAVDKAESDQETAFAVNADGVRSIANACREIGARLIQISTDFVFDGESSRPYSFHEQPNPLNVYGKSKFAGEEAVQSILGEKSVIFRTAWVYSSCGKNFVSTMLRIMSEENKLKVVNDQIGSPSWAKGIARALWKTVEKTHLSGILQWTDAGIASWYDFAIAIQEEALNLGLLTREIPVYPITTAEFPTPARRPRWSVLDTKVTRSELGLEAIHWRKNLRYMLQELKNA